MSTSAHITLRAAIGAGIVSLALSGLLSIEALAAPDGPPTQADATTSADQAEVPGQPSALLLGDSNMYGAFGHIMRAQLRSLGYDVRIKGRPSSGLARPDFWNWPEMGRALVRKYRPQVVIIIFGGNDGQRLRADNGIYKDGIPWTDEARWRVEYERRLVALADSLMDGATPSSRAVFILSPTNRRPPKARAKMGRIVELQRRVLAKRNDVTWINTFKLSSDGQGDYLRYGRGWTGAHVKLRRRDGIHMTREGAFHLTYALYPVLAEHLGWPRYQRHQAGRTPGVAPRMIRGTHRQPQRPAQ